MAPTKGKRMLYSEEQMDAACEKVGKGMALREVARTHGIPYPTLRGRVNGRRSMRKPIQRTILGSEEETKLTEWLIESSRRGFGRTKAQVMSTIQTFLNTQGQQRDNFKYNKPEEKWYRLFRARHKNELSQRTPQALGDGRVSVTAAKIANWFTKAKGDIDSIDSDVLHQPARLFNCDESGFQLCGGIRKVLTPKSDKMVHQETTDTHRQVTVLVCGNALGELQKPLLIFPGQHFNYDRFDGCKEAHVARSSNGLIDSEIFERWFETGFCTAVAHLPKPVVLFAYARRIHFTLHVHELCKEHSIILYQLPRHAIQPLNLTNFKNLKQAWKEEVLNFQEKNSVKLSMKHFAKVFHKAWKRKSHDGDVLVSGFRAAGIFPWNPHKFDTAKLATSRMFQNNQTQLGTDFGTDDMIVQREQIEIDETDDMIDETLKVSFQYDNDRGTGTSLQLQQNNDRGTEITASDMTLRTVFDRLLHLTANAGNHELLHYMCCYDMDTTTDKPEQQLFSKLYGRMLMGLNKLTDNRKTDSDCDKHGKKRTVKEPPKMCPQMNSGFLNKTKKKKVIEEAEEKERKGAGTTGENERKKKETERKLEEVKERKFKEKKKEKEKQEKKQK